MPNQVLDNQTLKSEADLILHQNGLLTLLQSYGETVVTGSYYLDLMVWPDLDLYVDSAGFSRTDLHDLLSEVCGMFSPKWIEAKEEQDFPPGVKRSFFLGFETEIIADRLWNVDIWFVTKEYIESNRKFVDRVKHASLTQRRAIYRLKQKLCQLAEYGDEFGSVDIYMAVLDGGVGDEDTFRSWLARR